MRPRPQDAMDRFGNSFAPGLPYARGRILTSTEDDVCKVRRAGRVIARRIRDHGPGSVFNFSGLERGLPLDAEDLAFADDEIAPALYLDRFRALALEHLGGNPQTHDAQLFNRVTAAVTATHLALVRPGDVVIGISAGYSHPSVVRAAAHAGAKFIDTTSVAAFGETLEREPAVALVALTRLAVTYDILPADDIRRIVRLAREKRAFVYVDDAGGARVGPAAFDQPRMLDLGVHVGATGLDKYGTVGPRLGLLAGEKSLVARIYARALEFGLEARPMLYPAAVRSLEQYAPRRVATLVETTKQVAAALRRRLGSRLHETPVTAQLPADDVLELAMERGRLTRAPVVPLEATAALAMLLLEDYGILTVHFAGLPPGTSSLLFKFIPPETLARFGGAEAFAQAIDHSLSKLGGYLREPESMRSLLLDGA
jgi:L-seryl-tRNA(Ser) seleniumtransferase